MPEDLTALDIATLSVLLAKKEVSPVEVTEAYLARIDRLNPRLCAYISVYPEQALAAAREAERQILAGETLGPLHGVPLAVKDLFQVEGMERTCGSPAMRGTPTDAEATSVTRLKAGGAVLLGLLNLHEFAFGPTGINSHFGTARNPWNPDCISGGSSSGSGCATAAALAAGTLGTDTGGSIRIPAALCGVVGLKQTYGLASRHGIYPVSENFDHGGPLARTVRDAALILQSIAGEDPHDSTTQGATAGDYCERLGRDLKGVRVGVPAEFFFKELHPEVEVCVREAIRTLEGLGAAVEEVSFPFMEEVNRSWNVIALSDAYEVHESQLEQGGLGMGEDVQKRLMNGGRFTGPEYARARRTQLRMRTEMEAVMERVHLLAMPTTPIPAVPIETGVMELEGTTVEGIHVLGRFTRLACFTGQPALSQCCGFSADGLPVGLQLIGRWFAEPLLLQVAHAYEQATSWGERHPSTAIECA